VTVSVDRSTTMTELSLASAIHTSLPPGRSVAS